MSRFVELDTQKIANDQKKDLQGKKDYLKVLEEQFLNVNKALNNTEIESQKNHLKENLKLLNDQISNTIIAIEILDSEFEKNAKPVLEDIEWKRTKLQEHWNELEKKLKNSFQ